MNKNKEVFYENQAKSIIKNLQNRKMEGFYCKDVLEAQNKLLELLGNNKKSIGYGGSMTLDENGFKDRITQAGHELIIRENYKTPEELKEVKSKLINCDYFLMSTNAISLDGQLINIDGRGNRVSFMIYGPESVIVICGMNKVVPSVEEGINRVRNMATPPNCNRLNIQTPCSINGVCGDCITNSICCQIVVTRVSQIPRRIKVILVGETLGF